MQSIPNDTKLIVEWVQPKTCDRFYELKAGNLYLGSLQFKSAFSSLALAETADGRWSFKQLGFCQQRITIREQGQQTDTATYESKFWGNNELRFNNGTTYIWKSLNFWSCQWALINGDGETVMIVKRGIAGRKFSDMFKTQMTVEMFPSKVIERNPTVLLPFVLYLIILQQQAATTAVIVAGA